ncbi:AMIN-like domain-containing (lipo)protein [Saccharothrix sp. DSM 118769]
MVRRSALLLVAALGLALAVPGAAIAANACAPVDWGSGAKHAPSGSQGALTDIRSGQHECFDRLVLDFGGVNEGYSAEYVDEVAHEGSGKVVPLRGGGKLRVSVSSPAHDGAGEETYSPANRSELVDVTGYATFRQAAWAGSFEGRSTIGLGTRALLPFRVFTLPGRVVVDVAHTW